MGVITAKKVGDKGDIKHLNFGGGSKIAVCLGADNPCYITSLLSTDFHNFNAI